MWLSEAEAEAEAEAEEEEEERGRGKGKRKGEPQSISNPPIPSSLRSPFVLFEKWEKFQGYFFGKPPGSLKISMWNKNMAKSPMIHHETWEILGIF